MKDGFNVHLLNRISLYRCSYLARMTTEYWLGHSRKKVVQFGLWSLWVRR